MKKRTRPFSALLALVLLLTACGSKGKEVHKVNWVTAPAYTVEDVALPVQTGDLIGCCTDGETMYILTDEKLDGEVRSTLNRVNLKDGTARELDGFQATVVPDGGTKITMGPVLAPDGTLWLYEIWSIAYCGLPDDFDGARESTAKYIDHWEEFHHLRQLDPNTGQQKKLADLSDAVRTLAQENAFDVSSFAVDGRGNIYICQERRCGGAGQQRKPPLYPGGRHALRRSEQQRGRTSGPAAGWHGGRADHSARREAGGADHRPRRRKLGRDFI